MNISCEIDTVNKTSTDIKVRWQYKKNKRGGIYDANIPETRWLDYHYHIERHDFYMNKDGKIYALYRAHNDLLGRFRRLKDAKQVVEWIAT